MILGFILSVMFVSAQELDQIEKRISEMPETPETLYYKARAYILQNLETGNSGEISAVIRLFSEKYHDTIPVVMPNEKILFDYWSGNYDDLLKAITGYGVPGYQSIYFYPVDLRGYSRNYQTEILRFFCEHQIELYTKLAGRDLIPADRDFLNLFLTAQLQFSKCASRDIEDFDLMAASGKYVREYPESPYNSFLRQEIAPEYVASPFGWGMLVFGCWGDHLLDYDEFFSYGGGVGFGADLEWDRLKSFYNIQAGFGKTKKEFTDNGEFWKKGQHIGTTHADISLGYAILENNHFAVVPHYGIDWLWIDQNNPDNGNNNNEDEPSVNLKQNHLIGITIDWNFSAEGQKSGGYMSPFSMLRGPVVFGRGFLRFRFGYLIPWGNADIRIENQPIDGRAYFANIGVGFTLYPPKKVIY